MVQSLPDCLTYTWLRQICTWNDCGHVPPSGPRGLETNNSCNIKVLFTCVHLVYMYLVYSFPPIFYSIVKSSINNQFKLSWKNTSVSYSYFFYSLHVGCLLLSHAPEDTRLIQNQKVKHDRLDSINPKVKVTLEVSITQMQGYIVVYRYIGSFWALWMF